MHKQIPASQIKPGMTYMTHYGPRVVTDAGQERMHGRDFFVWRWNRVSSPCCIDCGYGGIAVDCADSAIVSVAA